MEKMVYIILSGIVGYILAKADVNISDWRFWVILGCMCGANICGYISGMKSNI